MATRSRDLFLTIKTEGAILPTDLLQRIVEADPELGGLGPDAYHLAKGEKLTEATSRSWNRLLGIWSIFQKTKETLPAGEAGTSATRERWLLPLFQELGYGRLLTAKAITVDAKIYSISHAWNRTPIHLLGCRVDIDRPTPGLVGASRSSPHSLLQEFLNRSPDHRWGFLSNGLRLRILRDNASLTRQAYVEFDLEAMMQGEVYSDFVLLWLLCHESRVEAERPDDCWLEKWSQASKQRGVRALDQLSKGVELAIKILGRGFLAWPTNADLRERLRSGELSAHDYYRQLLRLVYRLLFLFAAEDRDLLLLPGEAHFVSRERYLRFYSTIRLRRLAERRTGTRHADLHAALRLIMSKLASNTGYPDLALPALGSFLFSSDALPDIETCEISNHDLLDAIRALATTVMNGVWRSVDYKNLGAEELGSVYESLLELYPRIDVDAATFELDTASGHERKTTGSYYTPTSLIECLLDSALNPVLDAAARKTEPEAEILTLKVVDPACGSGHFLIAAAHRMAKRLASIRTGDDEPSPEAIRTALRDVIGRCVYGVDANPMAVELCKVNLWLEALEPGKPLSFLEHRIQFGNSLLGATPRLLNGGIPDEAFQPVEGDLKEACTKWRKVNKSERKAFELGASKFVFEDHPWVKLGNFAASLMKLDNLGDDTIENVGAKARLWEEAVLSSDYLDGKLLADAWCAAFVWKKDSLVDFPITDEVFRRIECNPHGCEKRIRDEVRRLAREYRFFHWHLAFPDVFRVTGAAGVDENQHTGWFGGFDVVLGNPPWERIKLQEREWFAARHPDIANAPNAAARGRMIRALKETDPPLFQAFQEALRVADGESALVRNSGRYPLCGVGDINTYAIFAENDRNLLSSKGRMGVIVPSGIATDNTTKDFFASLVETNTLVSLYDFENAVGMFEGVGHGRFKFCLLTVSGSSLSKEHAIDFVFFAHHATDLLETDRHFTLTTEDIALINPNTRTCPIFRSRRAAEITTSIYRRVPVLLNEVRNENPWGVRFGTMFHMSNDSHLFRTKEQLTEEGWSLDANVFKREGDRCRYLPLYEAKMMHQFQHRYGDYSMQPAGSLDTELPRIPSVRLADANYVVQPRYWVAEWEVVKATANVPGALLQALDAGSENIIWKVLAAWIAGYHLRRGVEKAGVELLVRSTGNIFKSEFENFNDWLAARNWDQRWPLEENDFAIIRSSKSYTEMAERLVEARTPKWLFGFRKTARNTDARTLISSVIPVVAVGDKMPLLTVQGTPECLMASMGSFVLDFITRQKLGGTDLSNFYVAQLAVLSPAFYLREHEEFIRPRVLELTFTARDLRGFAEHLCYTGEPFRWDDKRRFLMRCELDALYFHLYCISRDDASYILDTFPIVRRKDEQQYNEYRTKNVILEIYDAMAHAKHLGSPYQTCVDPPPADPRVAHASGTAIVREMKPAGDHVPDLKLIAQNAWATPTGIQPENFILLALSEVLHRYACPVEPHRIWMAVYFVRKPALALPFLDKAEAKDWLRVIGPEAQPTRPNVVEISQFQREPIDPLWGETIRGLQSTNALIVTSGLWSAGANLPRPSDQEWLSGRAVIAVRLASTLTDNEATERMTEFLRSVEDGTATRAIS
jgi:Eco57I restriction-modification methylase